MPGRPYHHGGLRSALLSRAEQTLREAGVDGLSLRELARDVGVSHGAPRRHFRDKAALLDALATEGFRRLGATLERATRPDQQSFPTTLTEVAVAYVRFATDSPALLELMFTSKHQADASAELQDAATASFGRLEGLVARGQANGELVQGDLEKIGTVFFATMQGITSLANTNMVDRTALEELTGYAVQSLLTGLAPHASAREPVA